MESILTSIKKMLGITEEYQHFDADLIMHINSVLSILTQLGVGPSEGFFIEDDSATWYDFIPANTNFEMVKTYVHLRVKVIFDPPASSVVMASMERMINEFEWRINILAETMEKVTPEKPIIPDDSNTTFVIDDVSIIDRDIVMQYSGKVPNNIPVVEVSFSDGNVYIENNGNNNLTFSINDLKELEVSY